MAYNSCCSGGRRPPSSHPNQKPTLGHGQSWTAKFLLAAVAIVPLPERKSTKLATLVPKGSSYHKALLSMGEAWKAGPDGGAPLTVYSDGTMGGEADMVRRMRAGQLQAALISVTGLAEIDPAVTALQNLPMLFDSLDEATAVRAKLLPRLEKALADKGFVSLFWGDVGWVRFFTKEPVREPDDMKRVKLFTWSGSTEQADLMKTLGWKPVLLETADILPGLQTGLIDGVPVVPYFALKGQFFTVANHMLEIDWAPLVGALVVTKKAWDGFPEPLRAHCRAAADKAGDDITSRSRIENDEAALAMKKRGLMVQPLTPDLRAKWRAYVEPIWPRLRGLEIPPEMYDEVMRIVAETRAAKR